MAMIEERRQRDSQDPKARSAQAGFSLTEMMVVLVVTGILLTVAVPNFVRIGQRDQVETAAYDMQRTLALARQKALAKRTQYRVTINESGRYYYVERKQGGAWVADPDEQISWRDDVNLGLSLGGDGNNDDVVIEPQGTVLSQDAPAFFTFTNASGDTARVSLVRTGRIRVRAS